jgi:putative DNA primase/helicase
LRPGHITDFITKSCRGRWEENAQDPKLFINHLNWVFDDNQEVINYFHKLIGYCLTGHIYIQKFHCFWGEGGRGRSIIFDAIADIMNDYYSSIPAAAFTELDAMHQNDAIFKTRGSRIILARETGEQMYVDDTIIKNLVGNDWIDAYIMGKGSVRIKASGKPILYTNPQPLAKAKDDAFWRRWVEIRTTSRPVLNEDCLLMEKIKAERNLILAWAVRGYQKFKEEGLTVPSHIRDMMVARRNELDYVRRFLEDHCHVNRPESQSHLFVTPVKFIHAFNSWIEEECLGKNQYGAVRIKTEMERLGYVQGKRGASPHNTRRWVGVILKSDSLLQDIKDSADNV